MTLAIFKYDFANFPSIYITKKKQAWLTLSVNPSLLGFGVTTPKGFSAEMIYAKIYGSG